jgi:hypothetical protein
MSANNIDPSPDTFTVVASQYLTVFITNTTETFSSATLLAYDPVLSVQFRYECNPNPTLVAPSLTNQVYEERFKVGPTSYTFSPFTISANPTCTSTVTYTASITP